MGETSASEQLHGLLMQEDVGYKFTMETLKSMVSDAGLDGISGGAITGFIHRAIRHGCVQFAGKVAGEHGRMLHQYEILDREPWGFKAKGRGSDKGRTISGRHYNPVPAGAPEPEEKKETVKVSNYPVQSLLSDRLFNLAVEVVELEKKSLKDYSTDELIAELKTRVK